MANPFYINPPDPLQALMMGVQGYEGASKRSKESDLLEARRQAGELAASGDYKGALGASFRGGDIQGANVLAQLMEKQLGRSADQNSVFGTPIYGRTSDGKEGIGTFDRQGNFRLIDTKGFQVTPGVKTVDTPQGTYIIGSRSGAVQGSTMQSPPTHGAPVQGPTGQGQVPPSMTSPTPVAQQQTPGFIPNDNRGKAFDSKIGGEEAERVATYGKAKGALESGLNSLNELKANIKELKNHPGLNGILGIQGMFPNIPGTASSNAQAVLDTILARGGFAELQNMRDNSPTGGALGQVAVAEHVLLRDAAARLQRTQGTPAFKAALDDFEKKLNRSALKLNGAFKQDYDRVMKSGEQSAPSKVVPFSDYFRQQ